MLILDPDMVEQHERGEHSMSILTEQEIEEDILLEELNFDDSIEFDGEILENSDDDISENYDEVSGFHIIDDKEDYL